MNNIVKMSFDQVDSFFCSLDYAFHPRGIPDDEGPDERLMALWTIFLSYSGWTEDEFWKADRENKENCMCDKCKAEKDAADKATAAKAN